MNAKRTIKYFVPCMTLLAVALAQAADEPETVEGWRGEIMPKLYLFNYSDGVGKNQTQFLERYNTRDGWSGETRSGSFLDLDLNLAYSDGVRDVVTLERRGEGEGNHRGNARYNAGHFGISGYYSHFSSASGGIDYLYSPNQAPGGTDPTYNVPAQINSGYVARFNDDSGGQALYKTDRTTYGAGLSLKPGMLGEGMSLALNYDGYKRDGNKFATWIAGGGDFTGGVLQLERWRGYNKPIDEKMNKVSLNFTASPKGMFEIAYDGSLEKFDNLAQDFTIGDFAAALTAGTTIAGANGTKSLHFTPDSILMSHSIRLSKTFDATAVAAGYGMTRLEQDSFTLRQNAAGFVGEISTDNAFLNINHRVSPTLGMEGHIKYANRDNDSTFPAVGLLSATTNQTLGVRINSIESMQYGLSASFRALPVKSTLTAGWVREDTDRDLTWTDVSLTQGIAPQRSLYREQTVSDEAYLKWVARPMPGMTLRVTPSYLWADKTGLVTDPEESLNFKSALSYAATEGMQVNGYYNYKQKQNSDLTFTSALANDGLGAVQTQDVESTFHAAGVSINLIPKEQSNASVSFDWTQNDFQSYYFSSDRRRFEAGLTSANTLNFLIRDSSAYKVDTYSLSFNGDLQTTEHLKLSAGYTYSISKGDVGSGLIAAELLNTVDGRIDNTLHSITLGADFVLKKGTTLRGGYVYDKYDDDAYGVLSGSVHTLMLGLSYAM